MKKIYPILLIFLFTNTFAQKKGFKQLEKNNRIKAYQYFIEDRQTDSANAAIYYGLAKLFADRMYENYDLFVAFDYIQQAQTIYQTASDEQKTEFHDYFTKTKLENTIQTIDNELFAYVKRENNIETIDKFLKECRQSGYYEELLKTKYTIEYRNAKMRNSIEAFNTFIENYPDAPQIKSVKQIRNELAFDKVQKTHTPEAYQEFIINYPDAEQIRQAVKLRNELAFVKASEQNTIEAYNLFIKNYPESDYVAEAKKLKEKLIYNKTQNLNTVDAYTEYLHKYPNGEYYDELFNRKAETLAKKIKPIIKTETPPVFWQKVFDFRNDTEIPTTLDLFANDELIFTAEVKNGESKYSDAWIVKLNLYGNLIWNKTISTEKHDRITNLKIDNENNTIVGYIENAEQLNAAQNVKIAKIDTKGNTIWTQKIKASQIIDIDINSEDHLIVCTKRWKNEMFSTQITELDKNGNFIGEQKIIENNECLDFCLFSKNNSLFLFSNQIKLIDRNNKILWSFNFKPEFMPRKLLIDAENNTYIAGNLYDLRRNGKNDFALIKISNEGKYLWEKNYDRQDSEDELFSINWFKNELFLTGTTFLETTEEKDFWLLTIDVQGKETEQTVWGTIKGEEMPFMQLSSGGNRIILSLLKEDSNLIITKFR